MADPQRQIDTIDASARFDAADAARLNAMFHGKTTHEMLETLFANDLLGKVAIVSSFGAESAVLLHLIGSIKADIPVIFLETGKHFPETLDYRDNLARHIGLTNVKNITPDQALLTQKDESGLRWSYDPDGCCDIRKTLPLKAAVAGYDAQITGRKAFQAKTRSGLSRFEIEDGQLKVNPLADWDQIKVSNYMHEHNLPTHPLIEQGYLSIGCAPCTSIVKPGEDPRSGRWRGWDKTECGIHNAVPNNSNIEEQPEGNDPVF